MNRKKRETLGKLVYEFETRQPTERLYVAWEKLDERHKEACCQLAELIYKAGVTDGIEST